LRCESGKIGRGDPSGGSLGLVNLLRNDQLGRRDNSKEFLNGGTSISSTGGNEELSISIPSIVSRSDLSGGVVLNSIPIN